MKRYNAHLKKIEKWYRSRLMTGEEDPYLKAVGKIMTLDDDFERQTAFTLEQGPEMGPSIANPQSNSQRLTHKGQVLAESLLGQNVFSDGRISTFL